MGLQEDIKEMKEIIKSSEESKKEKKWRYPFGKKVGKSQKKKNYVTLIKINENGQLDFKKVQIDDQTFMEEGIPRLASAGYVLHHKKNPVIILPSWSVEPIAPESEKILKTFDPAQNYEESLKNGSNVVGYRLLMNRMKNEQVSAKKQMGGILKWIIGLALAGIIVYAILTGGG